MQNPILHNSTIFNFLLTVSNNDGHTATTTKKKIHPHFIPKIIKKPKIDFKTPSFSQKTKKFLVPPGHPPPPPTSPANY